jgi:hypothetical protein
MRYIILVILCAFNLTASAQWWRGDFKNHKRFSLIAQVKDHSAAKLFKSKTPFYNPNLTVLPIVRSQYNLELNERVVMRAAQHNMRFREYALASYKFSELAELYVKENRLSEAKWYYLQSIYISKQQNDDEHTINNLVSLAMVKADLGDLVQAQQDLAEARDLARTTGRNNDVKLIDTKIKFVLRYAEAADVITKTK